MKIPVSFKQDYSLLFSSLGKGASAVAGSNFLSDYASIKNGSYYKLMKAYYNGDTAHKTTLPVKNPALEKEHVEKLYNIRQATDSLKESSDRLLSLKPESKPDTVLESVKQFVKDYNHVIKAVKDSDSGSIGHHSASLVQTTASNMNLLKQAGITVEDDFTLSLSGEDFKKADPAFLKSLFTEPGSYAYRTSAQASFINFAAEQEIGKAGTYTVNGTYSSHFTDGFLFNSYF